VKKEGGKGSFRREYRQRLGPQRREQGLEREKVDGEKVSMALRSETRKKTTHRENDMNVNRGGGQHPPGFVGRKKPQLPENEKRKENPVPKGRGG